MELRLTRALADRRTALSAVALLAAVAASAPASALIQILYPDRPLVPDIAFTLTPEIPWLAYATDPLVICSIALLLWQALRVDRRRLPLYLSTLALTYLARSALMILTPLGRPTGNTDSYGVFEFTGVLQHGMFPSGHQMLASLAYFLVDRATSPRLKRAAGILAVLQGVALLLSRGHYSIDVAGGVMVAWIVAERLASIRDRFDLLAPPRAKPPAAAVMTGR